MLLIFSKETKKFLITDQISGRVLDTYEYSIDTGDLARVIVFADNQEARQVTEFSYDRHGKLTRSITQARGITQLQTKVIDYNVVEEYDGQNRLVKTLQTGNDGLMVETLYGYDEQGRLRGVAQMKEDGTVLMMDYEQ